MKVSAIKIDNQTWKGLMDEICGKKKFTLNDIKPGMVVELRNHDRMLVILVEGNLFL